VPVAGKRSGVLRLGTAQISISIAVYGPSLPVRMQLPLQSVL